MFQAGAYSPEDISYLKPKIFYEVSVKNVLIENSKAYHKLN